MRSLMMCPFCGEPRLIGMNKYLDIFMWSPVCDTCKYKFNQADVGYLIGEAPPLGADFLSALPWKKVRIKFATYVEKWDTLKKQIKARFMKINEDDLKHIVDLEEILEQFLDHIKNLGFSQDTFYFMRQSKLFRTLGTLGPSTVTLQPIPDAWS